MTLAPNLLIAAVLTLAPASGLAQTWPSLTVSSAPTLNQGRAATSASSLRPAPAEPKLNLTAPNSYSAQVREAPTVDVRAKPEWSDDQGLRVSPTRIAFKSRF